MSTQEICYGERKHNISTNVKVLKKWLDDFQITSIICIFIVIGTYFLLQWYILLDSSNDE